MHKTYLDFLQDPKFIEWKIIGNDELTTYWKEFKVNNPELVPSFEEAEIFLRNYRLNDEKMDKHAQAQLLQKIIRSNSKLKKRKISSIFSRVAAALLILVVALFSLWNIIKKPAPENRVIGNQLNDRDVILISNNKTRTFQYNVEIEIDSKGNAIVNNNDETADVMEIGQSSVNKIIVPYGKRSNLQLSDGTKLWLNSGSELEFPSFFSKEKREIKLLSGEMYIEVAPESKRQFFVQTPDFQVKVYGTKFNISIYRDYPQTVILAQGEISMTSTGQEEIKIYPNQKAIYHKNGEIAKERVNAQHYTSWKDGFIELYETPVTDILNYVGRYYNISFSYPQGNNLHTITCTGKLYLSESIDNVMNSIALLSSTIYENKNGEIHIINQN